MLDGSLLGLRELTPSDHPYLGAFDVGRELSGGSDAIHLDLLPRLDSHLGVPRLHVNSSRGVLNEELPAFSTIICDQRAESDGVTARGFAGREGVNFGGPSEHG